MSTKIKSPRAQIFTHGDVEKIYLAYPRQVGKQDALKAIRKVLATGKISPDDLLARVQAYAKSPAGNRGVYTPYPASWLNAGHYDDDQKEWQRVDEKAGLPADLIEQREKRREAAAIDQLLEIEEAAKGAYRK